jgi:hypothetical protein
MNDYPNILFALAGIIYFFHAIYASDAQLGSARVRIVTAIAMIVMFGVTVLQGLAGLSAMSISTILAVIGAAFGLVGAARVLFGRRKA